MQVEELRGKCERSRRGQQLAEVAAAQQAAALRQLELRLAQLSNEKEAGYWHCPADDAMPKQHVIRAGS